MSTEALLAIGEVAKRSGVPISTLHYYETQGLLVAERSVGNQRRYSRKILRRIAVIRVAQTLGVSLGEIAQALDQLPGQRTPTKADWMRLSVHWRASLNRRIDDLAALRDRLQGCIGCGCLSLRACHLYNASDRLDKEGRDRNAWSKLISGATVWRSDGSSFEPIREYGQFDGFNGPRYHRRDWFRCDVRFRRHPGLRRSLPRRRGGDGNRIDSRVFTW